ncbi:MAG: aspartate aminotransferase family protein [Bryobacterales bacterium]|nr:aspartate aminotransferase family protein [Bryobacterales bacterium]
MNKQEILLAHKTYLFPAVFHYFSEPLVLAKAKDQYVWDADGNQYLDFFGGIVTVSVGHCNERVNERVRTQLDRLQHVSTAFAYEPSVALAEKLSSIAPAGMTGADGAPPKLFFTNSGTEANETAIMAARCYTGAAEVIALRHSYHGRSSLGMSLTAHASWKIGGSPQPGIVHAHNAYCYRCPFGLTYPSCEVQCAKDTEELIRTTTSGRIAAFIAEPVQGVGGFITPPKEYFGIVAEIVRKYGGLFISDEVQTAWGRTGGAWFGIEQWGVTPDIMTSAKGLANGLPIGMTMARAEVANAMKGMTISTFGGNPIATTAAKAVLDFIEEKNLRANTVEVGAYLRERLLELQEKHELIGDVRGMGLLLAMELVEDRKTKAPASAATNRLMEAARDQRILLGKGGLYGNVLRLSPPMNIAKTDVDEFVRCLDRAFTAVAAPVG